jgi:hypothetical protein
MNYQQKYLKYKAMYLELKGGARRQVDWSNKAYVLTAVTFDGNVLHYVSPELRADREVILTAVTQNGFAIYYASQELQGDREVVLTAVTQNGLALFDASRELQSDREVVLTAVTQNGLSLEYTTPELRAEIENNGGAQGAPAMLQHYINVDIDIVDYSGTTYQIGNIQQFDSINAIKTWLRNHGGIGPGDFEIFDVETATIITTIEQLREYLFKFEINEVPFFQIHWV